MPTSRRGPASRSGAAALNITRIRARGNQALNGLVNLIYKTNYSDLCYGYNAFWRRCLPALDLQLGQPGSAMLWGDGFEVETLINIRAAKAQLRIVEVPSFEADRIHGVSNLNAMSDGLRVLRTITNERRRPAAFVQHSLLEVPAIRRQVDLRTAEEMTVDELRHVS